MRISDWSSDVCSSDLPARGADRGGGMTQRLTLRRPAAWHAHLRDGPMLAAVAGYTPRQFARAIVMPNLSPPITTAAAADAYRDRLLTAIPAGTTYTPLMPTPLPAPAHTQAAQEELDLKNDE